MVTTCSVDRSQNQEVIKKLIIAMTLKRIKRLKKKNVMHECFRCFILLRKNVFVFDMKEIPNVQIRVRWWAQKIAVLGMHATLRYLDQSTARKSEDALSGF